MISSMSIDFSLLSPAGSTLNGSGYFPLPEDRPFNPNMVTVSTPAPDGSKSLNRSTSVKPDLIGGFYAPGEKGIGVSVTARRVNGNVSFSIQARQSGDGTLNALLMDNYITGSTLPKFGFDNKNHGTAKPVIVNLPFRLSFILPDGSEIVAADETLKMSYTCTPNVIAKARYVKP